MSDQNPGQNPPADGDGPTQGGGGNGNGNGNGNNGNGNGNGNNGNGNGNGNTGNGNGENENGNGNTGNGNGNTGNGNGNGNGENNENENENGNGNGNGNTGNGNGNGNGNNGDNNNDNTSLDIPASAPAGALSVIKPAMTTTAFYKIAPSEFITFQWTLSDVIASPTSLTVRATGDNGNIYSLGENDGTIAGDATELVWNPHEWNQANPTLKLTPGEYRLNIWDDRGDGAPRRPGYMQAFNGLKFALYTPLPYTPLASGWTCTNCNAGTRLSSHPLSIALISTVLIVLLSSFTLLRGARRG